MRSSNVSAKRGYSRDGRKGMLQITYVCSARLMAARSRSKCLTVTLPIR
jgi:hypothetical protein